MAQVLDDLGDLTLVIGGKLEGVKPARYKVCSKALARASPVLKSMLYGKFAEAKPKAGNWVVQLPEDDADAFGIILHAIHGLLGQVPESITLDTLHAVATLADKYDLAPTLAPRIFLWRNHLVSMIDAACLRPYQLCAGWGLAQFLQALWISWVFGDTDTLERCVYCLATHAKANEQGRTELDDWDDSVGIFDQVVSIRRRIIERLLLVPQDCVMELGKHERPPSRPNAYRIRSAEQTERSANYIGRLVLALIRESLYPIPRATDYDCASENAASVYKALEKVVTPLKSHNKLEGMGIALQNLCSHRTCGVELSTEEQRNRLAAQAKKTSLSLYLPTNKRVNGSEDTVDQAKRQRRI